MEIKNILTFLRVVSLGSFTKAAVEMNYVQSTVTAQIQQLENELGYPLFDRIGKKIFLTGGGQQFLPYANAMADQLNRITMLGKKPCDVTSELQIGMIESLLFGVMLNILPFYKKQYPRVSLNIKLGQSVDLVELLKQNLLDLIYISAVRFNIPDLKCYYKRREYMVFLASPNHSLAQKNQVTLKEILCEPLTVTEHKGVVFGRLHELADNTGVPLQLACTVDSTVAISRLLQQRPGVTFLPEYSVASEIRHKQLAKLKVRDMPPQAYFTQILGHKNKWLSPTMEAFIQLVRRKRPER